MSNRSLLALMLLMLAVFLVVKCDLVTTAKVGLLRIIYGNEINSMKDFRIIVESPSPELDKEGLSQERIRQGLISSLEKAGIKSLTEAEWQNIPGKPTFNVAVNVTRTRHSLYQYTVTMEVEKSEGRSSPFTSSEKRKTLWSTSGFGEGSISDIQAKINEATNLFLKIYSGVEPGHSPFFAFLRSG